MTSHIRHDLTPHPKLYLEAKRRQDFVEGDLTVVERSARTVALLTKRRLCRVSHVALRPVDTVDPRSKDLDDPICAPTGVDG